MISQLIENEHISEFDNLYLDMNSILHTCTHSNDSTLTRMTEDQMYAAIFNYIDHLFDTIRPKEVFYMAIDGVAPRAKMNQQRARRFRTAFEAEENLAKAIKQGLEIPKEDPFDSNSITPGTEFMAKLTENLKYFIHKKMLEDVRWSSVKVILSGHEVPGEGEHKIMEYIRTMKAQKGANPNQRHCVYGLDADLIMLGLVSHELHFSLLREEVVFGPGLKNKSGDVHNQRFHLLHLSLLREYLELEFVGLERDLSFEYSFERVLDDFILIMYVIGNDFLPHLPDLHINKGAFPLLLGVFKESMRHLDGYINEGGTINLERLIVYFEYLSEFEIENFEKSEVDVEWFNERLEDISIRGEKKRARSGRLLVLGSEAKLVDLITPWLIKNGAKSVGELTEEANKGELSTCVLDPAEAEANIEFLKMFAREANFVVLHSRSQNTYECALDVDGILPHETEEELNERKAELQETINRYKSANTFATAELRQASKDLYDAKFVDWKDNYYKTKLDILIHDEEAMVELTKHYVEGLQWVLYYYYKGCASWSWFYHYHYAPRISDVTLGLKALVALKKGIEFDLLKPLKPFEQLMAVLPARSRKLMPDVYRPLMVDEHSPIKDYYPHEVKVDMNGKTALWEAVVLLDFVDEKRLLEVLKPIEQKLTPEESKRNSLGGDISFAFNPQRDTIYPTPLPGFFHELEHDHCYEEPFVLPEMDKTFRFDLPDGAKLGRSLLPGFASLYTVPFTSELKLFEVKVFNYPSKSESMVLTIGNVWEDMSVRQFAQRFLGKIVYTRWPFLFESRVTMVCDGEIKCELLKVGNVRKVSLSDADADDIKEYKEHLKKVTMDMGKKRGLQLGEVKTLVYVQPVIGMRRTAKGAYVKVFSDDLEVYPIQLIVESVENEDERYASRPPKAIEDEYPVDSSVVFLGAFAYGAPATVAGYGGPDKLHIRVDKIQSAAEPSIGRKRLDIENRQIRYLPLFETAKVLGLNGLFLSKITGSYMVRDKGGSRLNVGLDLRFDGRRLKVLGYTRKTRFWEYLPLAINLVKDYRERFPAVFNALQLLGKRNDMPLISEFGDEEKVREAVKWLRSIKQDLVQVLLESDSLTRFSMTAIEDFMEDYVSRPLELTKQDIKGVPVEAVINPSVSYNLLSRQNFCLGDRVMYVQESGKVPQLSKGTVVAIECIGQKVSLSVLFDHPLVGGNNMGGKLRTNRGTIVDSSLVLNLSQRQLVYHSQASRSRKGQESRAPRLKQPERTQEKPVGKIEKPMEKKDKEPAAKPEAEPKSRGNELLALLKGEKKSEEAPEVPSTEESSGNPNAIRLLYTHIYSDVMSQGAPQQSPIPVVPGVPLPPQFFQQPQSPGQAHAAPEWRGRGRGRGAFRGRGRGGRGRGAPRGLSRAD